MNKNSQIIEYDNFIGLLKYKIQIGSEKIREFEKIAEYYNIQQFKSYDFSKYAAFFCILIEDLFSNNISKLKQSQTVEIIIQCLGELDLKNSLKKGILGEEMQIFIEYQQNEIQIIIKERLETLKYKAEKQKYDKNLMERLIKQFILDIIKIPEYSLGVEWFVKGIILQEYNDNDLIKSSSNGNQQQQKFIKLEYINYLANTFKCNISLITLQSDQILFKTNNNDNDIRGISQVMIIDNGEGFYYGIPSVNSRIENSNQENDNKKTIKEENQKSKYDYNFQKSSENIYKSYLTSKPQNQISQNVNVNSYLNQDQKEYEEKKENSNNNKYNNINYNNNYNNNKKNSNNDNKKQEENERIIQDLCDKYQIILKSTGEDIFQMQDSDLNLLQKVIKHDPAPIKAFFYKNNAFDLEFRKDLQLDNKSIRSQQIFQQQKRYLEVVKPHLEKPQKQEQQEEEEEEEKQNKLKEKEFFKMQRSLQFDQYQKKEEEDQTPNTYHYLQKRFDQGKVYNANYNNKQIQNAKVFQGFAGNFELNKEQICTLREVIQLCYFDYTGYSKRIQDNIEWNQIENLHFQLKKEKFLFKFWVDIYDKKNGSLLTGVDNLDKLFDPLQGIQILDDIRMKIHRFYFILLNKCFCCIQILDKGNVNLMTKLTRILGKRYEFEAYRFYFMMEKPENSNNSGYLYGCLKALTIQGQFINISLKKIRQEPVFNKLYSDNTKRMLRNLRFGVISQFQEIQAFIRAYKNQTSRQSTLQLQESKFVEQISKIKQQQQQQEKQQQSYQQQEKQQQSQKTLQFSNQFSSQQSDKSEFRISEQLRQLDQEDDIGKHVGEEAPLNMEMSDIRASEFSIASLKIPEENNDCDYLEQSCL